MDFGVVGNVGAKDIVAGQHACCARDAHHGCVADAGGDKRE